MLQNTILNKLIKITQQPILIFFYQLDEKTDNSFEALKLIAREKIVTAGRISEYLDIKPSSVTQILKKLESIDAVKKVKSEEDAHVTFIKITQTGEELIKNSNFSSTILEMIFKEFSEADLEQLDNYLTRIYDNLHTDELDIQLMKIFSNERRWQQFSELSTYFYRAREQMMRQDRLEKFRGFKKH